MLSQTIISKQSEIQFIRKMLKSLEEEKSLVLSELESHKASHLIAKARESYDSNPPSQPEKVKKSAPKTDKILEAQLSNLNANSIENSTPAPSTSQPQSLTNSQPIPTTTADPSSLVPAPAIPAPAHILPPPPLPHVAPLPHVGPVTNVTPTPSIQTPSPSAVPAPVVPAPAIPAPAIPAPAHILPPPAPTITTISSVQSQEAPHPTQNDDGGHGADESSKHRHFHIHHGGTHREHTTHHHRGGSSKSATTNPQSSSAEGETNAPVEPLSGDTPSQLAIIKNSSKPKKEQREPITLDPTTDEEYAAVVPIIDAFVKRLTDRIAKIELKIQNWEQLDREQEKQEPPSGVEAMKHKIRSFPVTKADPKFEVFAKAAIEINTFDDVKPGMHVFCKRPRMGISHHGVCIMGKKGPIIVHYNGDVWSGGHWAKMKLFKKMDIESLPLFQAYEAFRTKGNLEREAVLAGGSVAYVMPSTIEEFSAGDTICVAQYKYEIDYKITELRAKRMLWKGSYNFIQQNCEHFATWCKTGLGISLQVNVIPDTLNLINSNLRKIDETFGNSSISSKLQNVIGFVEGHSRKETYEAKFAPQ